MSWWFCGPQHLFNRTTWWEITFSLASEGLRLTTYLHLQWHIGLGHWGFAQGHRLKTEVIGRWLRADLHRVASNSASIPAVISVPATRVLSLLVALQLACTAIATLCSRVLKALPAAALSHSWGGRPGRCSSTSLRICHAPTHTSWDFLEDIKESLAASHL